MKIAFVQNFWYEYLGVMSISAVLKKNGYTTQVFINGWEKDLVESLAVFNPDVVAFPVYSGSERWVLKTAFEIKKKLKKMIVLGGPHATFFPQIIKNKGIDIICRGEGENPMLDLMEALKNGNSITGIENLWVKIGKKIIKNSLRPLVNPLDNLPLLDRDLYYRYPILKKTTVKNFNVGRGCPYACSYCHNSGLVKIYKGLGSYVRYYKPSRAVEEILRVKNGYPLKIICFVDDTFIADKKWLLKFLPLYKKRIGLPFSCNIRGNLLDKELAKCLAKAGCVSVFMGVESGNEEMRIRLLKKTVTNQHLLKAAKLLHGYGIKIAANNMFGLPGETLNEAFETIRLNIKLKVDLPWCSIFQPYPGTEMADYCFKNNYLTKKELQSIGETFQKRSILKSSDVDKLVNLHKFFHIAVWNPWLIPVIKILIKLPLAKIYDWLFLFNQGLTYMRFYHLNFLDFAPHAYYFGKFYLTSRSRNN